MTPDQMQRALEEIIGTISDVASRHSADTLEHAALAAMILGELVASAMESPPDVAADIADVVNCALANSGAHWRLRELDS